MTARFILLCFVMYALIFTGLVTLNGTLVALTLPFIVFIAAAYQNAPQDIQLKLQRKLSAGFVVPDTEVDVTLTIENSGAEPYEVLIVDNLPDELKLVDGQTHLLTMVAPGEAVELTYRVLGPRGGFYFRPVNLTVFDRLGLFTKKMVLDAPGQMLVKPEVIRLRPLTVRPPRTHGFTGAIAGRQGGTGTSFFGVREYQLGDLQRRINWKSSARHDMGLYTNEFERERVADVGLILDARQRTDVQAPRGTLFEYGVSAAAALADMFLQSGNRVGLLIYGRGQETTFPGYGKMQREKILRALAQAAPGDNMALESFSYLPTRFFPPRSQIILISPLCQEDQPVLERLRSYGYQLLIVSPDPVDYEGRMYGFETTQPLAVRIATLERQLILRRLQRAGILVVDWKVEQPLNQALFTAIGRSAGQPSRGRMEL